MIELISTRLDHTVAIGERLGELCVPGDVIALDGELGAGKTQFVRGLARGMNLDPTQVSSPTFVFMHEYLDEDDEDATPLIHIDAYRVTGPDDLATLGFDDELRDTSVTAVEWATLIEVLPGNPLGEHRLHVRMEHTRHQRKHQNDPAGGGQRRITLEPHGRWADRLLLLKHLAPGQ